MQILDNLIIITLIVSAFIAGMKLDKSYRIEAQREKKEALERQFVRLRVKADADDPCKPYVAPQCQNWPISEAFMNELKTTGKAKTTIRKPNSK